MRFVSLFILLLCSCAARYRDATVVTPVVMTTEIGYTVIIDGEYISVCLLEEHNISEGDSIAVEVRLWPDGSFDILRVLGPTREVNE